MALNFAHSADWNDEKSRTHSDWDIVKSKYQVWLLIWGGNILLLACLATYWWQGVLAGVVMGALGMSVSARLIRQERAAAMAVRATERASLTSDSASYAALSALVQDVLPAWRSNVQLARSQTQDAIDKLTLRFVGIHRRLGEALHLAEAGGNHDVRQVIQHASVQLGGIAVALEQVLSTRDALLQKIEMLSQHNEEIRQLAQEVERLAGVGGTTDLFAEQQSWSDLAARSAQAGRHIFEKTKAIQSQIQVALTSANQLDADAGRMIVDSRQVIDTVIADFRLSALELSGTVDQLEGENRGVDEEVCDILVNLQFQDRISQILDHVQLDMSKLVQMIGQDGPVSIPASTTWLAELEKTYTTPEQRQVHVGQNAGQVVQSQVDFF